MPQQPLNRANIRASLQQVCRKGMPKRVRADPVGGKNMTLSWRIDFLTADHAEYADSFRVFRVFRGYRSGRRSAAGPHGKSGQIWREIFE